MSNLVVTPPLARVKGRSDAARPERGRAVRSRLAQRRRKRHAVYVAIPHAADVHPL